MPTSPRTKTRFVRRVGSATVVGVAGAGALLGSAGTAGAAIPTTQTIDAAPTPVTEGSPIAFSGKLTGFADKGVADRQVDLEWRGAPDQPWQVSNVGQTDDQGAATIPATITTSAEWRLTFHGDKINDASSSSTVNVESQQKTSVGQQIVDAASTQAGKPYSYGGNGPDSYDCSGLTKFAHAQVGIDLPRRSGDQAAATSQINKADKQPGDLLFFSDGGSVYHTGIFAGGNQMWAAPESGDVVKKQDIWTESYTVGRAW